MLNDLSELKVWLQNQKTHVEEDLNAWERIKLNNGFDTAHLVNYPLTDVEYHLTYLKGYKEAFEKISKELDF